MVVVVLLWLRGLERHFRPSNRRVLNYFMDASSVSSLEWVVSVI
jgi:hypothetical protein